MRINRANCVSFRAELKGDVAKIRRISQEAGLSEEGANKALEYLNKLLPNENDKVYMYFRKYQNEDKSKESIVRSGIKIVKNGVVIEKNINPINTLQKNLLYKMIYEVVKLINGKTQPDSFPLKYPIPAHSWLDKFNDTENKLTSFTPLI